MKILVVADFYPYPLNSGAAYRLYYMLKGLCSLGAVWFVCFNYGEKNAPMPLNLNFISSPYTPTPRGKLKKIFSSLPDSVYKRTCPAMRKILRGLIKKENFDFALVEEPYVYENIKGLMPPEKIILDEQNIEYDLFKQEAEYKSARTSRYKLRNLYETMRLKKYERQLWEKLFLTVFASEKEYDEHRAKCKNAVYFNNPIDLTQNEYAGEYENYIVFAANFNHPPNISALSYFLDSVNILHSRLKLKIIGKGLPESFLKYEYIEYLGEVADALSYIKKAFFVIAPLLYGGGSRYKILTALAAGVPVVSTEKGREGISFDGILTFKNKEELQKAADECGQKQFRARFAEESRKYIKAHHNPEGQIKKIKEQLKND